MHQLDTRTIAQKILSLLSRVTGISVVNSSDLEQTSSLSHENNGSNIDREQCCSGGYNEAFVFEFWASYGPRH